MIVAQIQEKTIKIQNSFALLSESLCNLLCDSNSFSSIFYQTIVNHASLNWCSAIFLQKRNLVPISTVLYRPIAWAEQALPPYNCGKTKIKKWKIGNALYEYECLQVNIMAFKNILIHWNYIRRENIVFSNQIEKIIALLYYTL